MVTRRELRPGSGETHNPVIDGKHAWHEFPASFNQEFMGLIQEATKLRESIESKILNSYEPACEPGLEPNRAHAKEAWDDLMRSHDKMVALLINECQACHKAPTNRMLDRISVQSARSSVVSEFSRRRSPSRGRNMGLAVSRTSSCESFDLLPGKVLDRGRPDDEREAETLTYIEALEEENMSLRHNLETLRADRFDIFTPGSTNARVGHSLTDGSGGTSKSDPLFRRRDSMLMGKDPTGIFRLENTGAISLQDLHQQFKLAKEDLIKTEAERNELVLVTVQLEERLEQTNAEASQKESALNKEIQKLQRRFEEQQKIIEELQSSSRHKMSILSNMLVDKGGLSFEQIPEEILDDGAITRQSFEQAPEETLDGGASTRPRAREVCLSEELSIDDSAQRCYTIDKSDKKRPVFQTSESPLPRGPGSLSRGGGLVSVPYLPKSVKSVSKAIVSISEEDSKGSVSSIDGQLCVSIPRGMMENMDVASNQSQFQALCIAMPGSSRRSTSPGATVSTVTSEPLKMSKFSDVALRMLVRSLRCRVSRLLQDSQQQQMHVRNLEAEKASLSARLKYIRQGSLQGSHLTTDLSTQSRSAELEKKINPTQNNGKHRAEIVMNMARQSEGLLRAAWQAEVVGASAGSRRIAECEGMVRSVQSQMQILKTISSEKQKQVASLQKEVERTKRELEASEMTSTIMRQTVEELTEDRETYKADAQKAKAQYVCALWRMAVTTSKLRAISQRHMLKLPEDYLNHSLSHTGSPGEFARGMLEGVDRNLTERMSGGKQLVRIKDLCIKLEDGHAKQCKELEIDPAVNNHVRAAAFGSKIREFSAQKVSLMNRMRQQFAEELQCEVRYHESKRKAEACREDMKFWLNSIAESDATIKNISERTKEIEEIFNAASGIFLDNGTELNAELLSLNLKAKQNLKNKQLAENGSQTAQKEMDFWVSQGSVEMETLNCISISQASVAKETTAQDTKTRELWDTQQTAISILEEILYHLSELEAEQLVDEETCRTVRKHLPLYQQAFLDIAMAESDVIRELIDEAAKAKDADADRKTQLAVAENWLIRDPLMASDD